MEALVKKNPQLLKETRGGINGIIVLRTCIGNIQVQGPTFADANAKALAALDAHNSKYHVPNNSPFCRFITK